MSRFDQIYDRRGTGAIKYDTLEHTGFGADTLPLWVADMDFPAPECVGEALRRMTDPGIYGYTMTGTAYNTAVTGWFERRFGWKPEEDWLVTTPGVVYAICTAIRAFTEPGEAVMCLLPVYSHFFTAVEDNGRRPVYGHLKRENGHYEIDFEELERLLDEERPRLLILCSPHNPVGRVWKREELERLGRLCFDRGVLVVADEIHHDLIQPGYKHIVYASLGKEFADNCVICTSLSKTFNLAGLVGSYHIVYNNWWRDRIGKESGLNNYNMMNVLSMHALIGAYQPEGYEWTDELCEVLSGNVNFACDYIEQHFAGVTVSKPEGTYMLFVDCTDWCAAHGKTIDDVEKACWDVGVAVQDGKMFHGPCHLRMNLASPRSRIEEAFRRMDQYVFHA